MNKYIPILLLLLSITCLQCSQSGGESKNAEKGPLKIGLVTWIGYGPFYIAQEKGYFKKYGVEVELDRIEGDAERRAAIASGRLDASCMTLDAMIVLRSRGIDVQTILALDASRGGDGIVVTNDITDIAQLRGMEIAFPTGLPSHYFLYQVLKDAQLSVADIKPIVMDADKAGAAFVAGKVDAAVTWEPWLTKAEENNGKILVDTRAKPDVIEDVLFVKKDVLAKRGEDFNALASAWFDAVAFLQENPEESKQIIGRAFSLTTDEINIIFPKVRFEGRTENLQAFGTADEPGFLYDLYEQVNTAWLEENVISVSQSPDDGIEAQVVRSLK